MPALAEGGDGGPSILHPGGVGGAGFEGATGGAGTLLSAGGGGAAGGGRGGDGSGLTPGEGGAGGTAGDPDGRPGGDGFLPVSSGGGGGGGFNGTGAGVATITNSGILAGGSGGHGGDGGFLDGSGGGGGAGGSGAVATGGGVSSNLAGATIRGGDGGRGGIGKDLIFAAGDGGDGGVGLQLTTPGATFINAGTITGGNGGGAGGTRLGADSGIGGTGGIGIVGAGVTIINSGTISPGFNGRGSPALQPNAITFTGGVNILELRAGSTINGVVSAFSAADTLRLGGSADSTFDVSSIGVGAQYRNFGVFEKDGTSTWTLTGNTTALTPWTVNAGTLAITTDNLGAPAGTLTVNGGTLQASGSFALDSSRAVTLGSAGGTFNIDGGSHLSVSGGIGGPGALIKVGAGALTLGGSNLYAGGTVVNDGLLVMAPGASLNSSGALTVNGGTFDLRGNVQTVGTLSGSGGTIGLGSGTLTTNSDANSTLASVITGPGAFVKQGNGTLILTGLNNYTGGTTVSGGTLQGTTSTVQGNIRNDASVVFSQAFNGTYAGAMSGSGSVTLQGGATFTFTGNNTYTGPTTVTGSSTFYANGTMASDVVLTANSTLRGNGTVGGVVSNNGILAPGILTGNSIGTLTVTRNFVQSGGTYRVEVNSSGQNDRVNVGGTAAIAGGAVQAFGSSGSYANSTTYTILHADGGVSGAYGGVISDFAFLTPTLTYDANNVFLTLALQGNPFSGFGGNTPNQRAVGYALDQSYANATGDFATVIGALAGLNTQQAPLALSAISGEQWADFGTMNLASNSLFMNALGQQMAMARTGQGAGQRVAMAQACDVSACDGTSPFSAWASGLGGLGSVQGDGNASTLTYNFGGVAAGIDYRIDPRFLVGLGVAYTHGTQWVNSFSGTGWTDAVSVALYGSYTQGAFYADALAGYAYSSNRLQRQIAIPNLTQRTANGSTGANQFLGQVELGYRVPVYAPASATLTPFARLQVMNVSQNAFSETGANALSLNVQQQATNALRSTFGAELAGGIPMGEGRTFDIALRLGWQHEYAYTGRPITAAFAGAPAATYTVYGATPQRDAALIGLSAGLPIANGTSVYARYDGDVGGGTDNHAFGLGLRMSW